MPVYAVQRRIDASDNDPLKGVPNKAARVILGRGEDFTAASKKNADWQPAWLRAIALAWSSTRMKEDLIADPKAFLLNYCGFELPDHLLLTVREDDDPESGWDPTGGDDKPNTWLWKVKQTELTMYIPKRPEDADQRPVALAAYEALGRVYPFTTCC
jgi:ribosomally synthesized peptide (two-chain TOMM family)